MLANIVRNEEQWDAFVLKHGGCFLQSWGWSQFQESLGRNVYRFRIDAPSGLPPGEGSDLTVVQFLLVMQPMRFGLRYAYVPRGPIIDPQMAGERLQSVTETLRETLRREGAIFARVEFPFRADESPVTREELESWGLVPSKTLQPRHTLIVDLSKSEEQLLGEMHGKTRYNIRLAQRHGVTVREAEYGNAHLFRHDVDLFWKLMQETSARDGFRPHPKEYYEKMLDVLSAKKHAGLLRVRLVFAEYQGEAAAAAIVGAYGDTVTYLHGCSVARLRQVMAPFALHWNLMTEAKKQGFTKYDFWGVAPTDDQGHPWAGMTRFKTGFGGERVSYLGAWDLPGKGFWYKVYRTIKR